MTLGSTPMERYTNDAAHTMIAGTTGDSTIGATNGTSVLKPAAITTVMT